MRLSLTQRAHLCALLRSDAQRRAIDHGRVVLIPLLSKAASETDNEFVRRSELVTRNISGRVGSALRSPDEYVDDAEAPRPPVRQLRRSRLTNQLREAAHSRRTTQSRTPTAHSEREILLSGLAGFVFLVVAATILRFALKLSLWAMH